MWRQFFPGLLGSSPWLAVLLVLTSMSIAEAQRGGRGTFGFRTRFLIELPEVRAELGIRPEQATLLDDLQADLSDQFRALSAEIRERGPARNDPESQQAQAKALREKLEAFTASSEELIDVVLEPAQVERLSQLRLQRDGLRVLNRPELVGQLSLTPEQQQRLDQLRQAATESLTLGFDPRRLRELREKQEAEFLEVLSQEQQATWQKLKGKPFTFPEPRFGRSRGNP